MHILSACEHRCEKREEGFPACLSACQILGVFSHLRYIGAHIKEVTSQLSPTSSFLRLG